jgi:four helix bundle protein
MKQPAKNFQDLLVWQKAHEFVLATYRLSGSFSKSELFGLTSQLRRASISIPANIAEGFKKRGAKDKLRLLNVAQGSAEETHYYLILAQDLGYGNTSTLREAPGEVVRMLEAYSKALSKNHPSP